MTLDLDAMMALVESFMLPFVRLGALLMAAPFYGARTVPVRIRILLAFVVTIVLFPSLRIDTPIDLFTAEGLLLIVQQVAVGLAMGLILQFILAAVVMGGHTIATSMGLGFASSVDPQNGVQVTIVGQ